MKAKVFYLVSEFYYSSGKSTAHYLGTVDHEIHEEKHTKTFSIYRDTYTTRLAAEAAIRNVESA